MTTPFQMQAVCSSLHDRVFNLHKSETGSTPKSTEVGHHGHHFLTTEEDAHTRNPIHRILRLGLVVTGICIKNLKEQPPNKDAAERSRSRCFISLQIQ